MAKRQKILYTYLSVKKCTDCRRPTLTFLWKSSPKEFSKSRLVKQNSKSQQDKNHFRNSNKTLFVCSCDLQKSVLREKVFQGIGHNKDDSNFSPLTFLLDTLRS